MAEEKSLIHILGIDVEQVTEKSVGFAQVMCSNPDESGYDFKAMSDYVKETFTENELHFIVTVYLHQKTEAAIDGTLNNQSIH